MGWLNGVLAAYALLTIVGGVMGYVSKQSMASLMAGVGVGVVLIGAIALSKSHPKPAYAVCAVVVLLTGLRFTGTFMSSREVWPHLVVAAASAIALAALIAGHFMQKPATP